MSVEDAVRWRNDPSFAKKIVVFAKDEAAKMHSLNAFDTLTSRDLVERLLKDATKDENLTSNNPQQAFWEALLSDAALLQLNMLLDYMKSVEQDENLNAISKHMWKLGLLADRQLLNAGTANEARLRLTRNRNILFEMEQLSKSSRRRMQSALTRTKVQDREVLRQTYRKLMRFYRTGDRRILLELDLDDVEILIRSGKTRFKFSRRKRRECGRTSGVRSRGKTTAW